MLADAILDVIRRGGAQVWCEPEGNGWRVEAVLPDRGERLVERGGDLQEAAIRMAIAVGIDVEE